MTSYMQIMVRVVSNRAMAQMAALRGEVAGLSTNVAVANKQQPLGWQHMRMLTKFGNQLQWTGRMLLYNFTLPIIAAGAAATKWAMDNEKAMTHVTKVYGDTRQAAMQFRKESKGAMTQLEAEAKATRIFRGELKALEGAFTAISNKYGVAKKDVLEVAGAWAAAGVSGLALAKSVNLTMKAIIIGDMDATEATKALISIQAQYNLSSQELNATLAQMNSIENATAVSMQDLIIGFEKSAGMARQAGVSTQELGAMMAALVPATGSAANAGNALKTILSRLVAPTADAAAVMKEMGLDTTAMGWNSSTATERLHMMAKEFATLGAAQQGWASSIIASRWQVNRFAVLMKALVDPSSKYAQALKASEDQGYNFVRMQKELNTVLQSDPRRMQRMWVMIQNGMSSAIIPIIPHILYLVDTIAKLTQAFADLAPNTQKIILYSLLLLAAIGPLVRYIGALTSLYAVFGFAVLGVVKVFRTFITVIAPIGRVFMMMGTLIGTFLGYFGAMVKLVVMGFFEMTGAAFAWAARTVAAFVLWNGGVVAAFAAGWARLVAINTAGAVMLGKIQFIFGMLQGILMGAMGVLTTAIESLWIALYVGIAQIMARGQVVLLGLQQTFFATMTLGTAGLYGTLQQLFWEMQRGVAAGWIAFQRGMVAVQLASAQIMGGIWTALNVGFVNITKLASVRIAAIWTASTAFISGNWKIMALNFKTALLYMWSQAKVFSVRIITVMTGPWGIAIALIIGLLYTFRDALKQIWQNVVGDMGQSGFSMGQIWSNIVNGILKLFYSLPQGVQDVMVQVVTIIRDAALAVYDWFSYINPWAQHSPSLVDNVTSGMDRVMSEFGKLAGIKKILTAAYAEIKRFGELTKSIGASAAQQQMKEDRHSIKKAGGGGAALASFDKMHAILGRLQKRLEGLQGRIDAQQRVVDKWQKKVDQANKHLQEQQDILDKLGEKVDKWQSKLDEANDRISTLASTPLKGMREMEDAIFNNEMATKRMRLEMMNLEDVYGTFDDIKSKIDSINGAQEMISGQKNELRAAGAGSEILKNYDDQLAALDKNKDAYAEQAKKIGDLQKQIDALGREAERLDLVKSLNFDGLQRQIDQAVEGMHEMSFEDIMSGIKSAQEDVAVYTQKLNDATDAYNAQQQVVNDAIALRDQYQARLDAETQKLDNLQKKYDEVNAAIQAIEQSLNDVVAAAEKMNDALAKKAEDAKKKKKKKKDAAPAVSANLQGFRDAAGGDFPDVGGSGMPNRKDWSSQADQIKKFTEDMGQSTADLFAQLNPFEPLKEKAKAAWEWIKEKAKNIIPSIGEFFQQAFEGVSIGKGPKKVGQDLKAIGEFITGVLKDIGKWVKWAVDFISPELKKIWDGIKTGLQDMWNTIGPKLAKFKDLVAPLGEAFQNVWTILKPVLAFIGGGLIFLIKGVLGGIAKAIGPLLDTIGKALGGIIDVIRGVFEIIIGIFTLNGDMIVQGLKDIFGGLFTAIYNIIKAPLELVYNFIIGFFTSIWDGAKWLYDELVGHSIIPDLVDGIAAAFVPLIKLGQWIWDHVLQPVLDFFVWLWKNGIKPEIDGWWALIKGVLNVMWALGQWVWDHILKPVLDFFVWLWKNGIKPEIDGWWGLIKGVLTVIWALGQWVWDHILKPVLDFFIWLWKNGIKPEIDGWWGLIKGILTVMWTLGQWVWDHILKPVLDFFIWLWKEGVKPELDLWEGRVKTVWNGLTNLGTWVKTNVMDPVFNAFKTGWTDIKTWFTTNADILTKPVNTVVNAAIKGVNALIDGLNKISDILPGIDFHITPIPTLATGGKVPKRRVGSGFITNGARAIVGEGKANYPEYVIPTDPTHRRRSIMLLHDAAKRVGITSAGTPNPGGEMGSAGRILAGQTTRTNMDGVPMYGIGGVIGWVKDQVGNAAGAGANWLVNKGKDMASFLSAPFFSIGKKMIDNVGWIVPREISKYGLDQVQSWVNDVDKAFNDIVKDQMLGGKGIQDAVAFAKAQVGKPYIWAGVGPDGYDCSGFMSALTNVIRGENPYHRVGSTGSFPWPGFKPGVAGGPGFTIGSSPSYSGGIGHMAGTLAGMNVESAGGVGVRVGASARGYNDPGFTTHAYLAMKQGGIAMRRSGGTPVVVGDGRYDEAVVPLPKDWRSSSRGEPTKTYHFHGDLSFPNVTNGDDAESFLNNLDNLAKD